MVVEVKRTEGAKIEIPVFMSKAQCLWVQRVQIIKVTFFSRQDIKKKHLTSCSFYSQFV